MTNNRPILFLSLILLILASGPPKPAAAQTELAPVITGSNRAGLTLTWQPPSYQITTVETDGHTYSRLQLPDLPGLGQPGHPELPLYSTLIGLPPTGAATLRIVDIERDTIRLAQPPLPAPVPQPVSLSPADIDPGSVRGGPVQRLPDPTVYTNDAFYPETVATLGHPQLIRDRRVAALTIHPLRVNPVSREMEVIRFLRLEISFTQPAAPTLSPQQASSDPFAQSLAATLLNPEAVSWTAPHTNQVNEAALTAQAAGAAVKIKVDQAGLYALTYTALQNAGLPLNTLDPRTLKLSHGYPRQEIAIRVEGQADGVFNSGDRLLFYAEPQFSRYVDYDVYFLSYGGANGLRMTTRSGSPTGLPAGTAWRTAQAELNQFYDPLYPARDGDHWYWAKLAQPDQTAGSYPIQLTSPLTTGPQAALTLWLQGYTDPAPNPDHRVRVSINGTLLGEETWNGKQAREATFNVPAAALTQGSNQVSLSLPGSGTLIEGTWLDAMALTYPTNQGGSNQLRFQGESGQKQYTLTGWSGSLAVYDITEAHQPKQISGYQLSGSTLTVGDATATTARYLVVPQQSIKTPLALEPVYNLADPPAGADYIIITHPSLAAAVAPLATYRTNLGLRVITVDTTAIYDTYGPGRLDPEAIKTFLDHAYHTWPAPAPLYVLLVGDGHYDFKNYTGYNAPNLLPPYLAQVDPWWGETASDNRLVTLDGSDNLPEMMIGRLPVNTPAEATTVIDKIIQYETAPAPGDWNAFQLFVADNPDSAGDFHAEADTAYNTVTSPFLPLRLYYDNTLPADEGYLFTNPETLRARLLYWFNHGASLITFHGHSSWLQWAVEDLFQVDDVGQLHNQERWPVILEMTCFTGFFHHPAYPHTLDETLLRQAGGGAVAVWGSTGLGVGTGHRQLQAGFYDAIHAQPQPQLGAAIIAGKLNLYATGLNGDLLDTYTLFGDPALHLNLTVIPIDYTDQIYLPTIVNN